MFQHLESVDSVNQFIDNMLTVLLHLIVPEIISCFLVSSLTMTMIVLDGMNHKSFYARIIVRNICSEFQFAGVILFTVGNRPFRSVLSLAILLLGSENNLSPALAITRVVG